MNTQKVRRTTQHARHVQSGSTLALLLTFILLVGLAMASVIANLFGIVTDAFLGTI